jgi:predicted RNA-binding Zn-ribbon protein involved in translation (DUF1610 family)
VSDLIRCGDCGAEMSRGAFMCPKCGSEIGLGYAVRFIGWTFWLCAGGAIAVGAGSPAGYLVALLVLALPGWKLFRAARRAPSAPPA